MDTKLLVTYWENKHGSALLYVLYFIKSYAEKISFLV
jgi:hypothetical protein